MPSEYTDEIENSSYIRRAFSMGRKSKYSAEEKLLILPERQFKLEIDHL